MSIRFRILFCVRIGEVVEGVGTALGNEIVHGNALLLGDGAQAAHKVFRQAKGLADHFCSLHMEHRNPLHIYYMEFSLQFTHIKNGKNIKFESCL